MAGMFATEVIGTFCPFVGGLKTGGFDEQATNPIAPNIINNFFIVFPYSSTSI
jgi:hypothetical protein